MILTLNRPKALNALSNELLSELKDNLVKYDKDETVGCFIITGNDNVFAAGADIKGMAKKGYNDIVKYASEMDVFDWSKISKPVIAAVSGYAFGGGCEIAMMSDIAICAENAMFG